MDVDLSFDMTTRNSITMSSVGASNDLVTLQSIFNFSFGRKRTQILLNSEHLALVDLERSCCIRTLIAYRTVVVD